MEDLKYSQRAFVGVGLVYFLLFQPADDLLSTLITVLQIQDVTQNVVTRTMALLSLISALVSLIFGCIYILRFSAMRTMRKAAKWAEVCFLPLNRGNTIPCCHIGSTEVHIRYLLERLGLPRLACLLACLVRSIFNFLIR